MDSIPTNRRTPAAWFFSRLRRQHRAYLCQEPGAEPISAPGGRSRVYPPDPRPLPRLITTPDVRSRSSRGVSGG